MKRDRKGQRGQWIGKIIEFVYLIVWWAREQDVIAMLTALFIIYVLGVRQTETSDVVNLFTVYLRFKFDQALAK